MKDFETGLTNTFNTVKELIDKIHNLVGDIMAVFGEACVFCDALHASEEA